MSHKWQIMPEITNDVLSKEYGEVAVQLLANRGLQDREVIESFFSDDFEKYFHSPFLFKSIEESIALIIKHIKAAAKIVIYGDYDADGATASACLYETLKTFKADVEVYIPERKSEGYGLNEGAIKFLNSTGVNLIITVDCAIRNKQEVDLAKSLGMDVLITDHHLPPDKEADLPACLILNPKVAGEAYPFKDLAGVGVALKLCQALILRAKIDDNVKKALFIRLLDVCAIGTVADCVPLLGENRVIVKKGLEIMNATKRLGLIELIKISKINGDKGLDSWNIGFQLAPRINAAGRLGHANTAFELLITKDQEEAENLARHLNDKNQERQALTEEVVIEMEEQLKHDDFILIGVTPNREADVVWEEGIVGLVAGRVAERYYKPTLVITRNGDTYKGSGRSIREFNLVKALEACKDNLVKFGGHAQAAGFSLDKDRLDFFISAIKSYAENALSNLHLLPQIKIDMELPFSEVDDDLAHILEKFAPFGQNNPESIFLSRTVAIVDVMHMGIDSRHIKLKLKSRDSRIINAIGFGQAEKWKDLKIGELIDIVYTVEMNHFNGRSDVQIKIVDIKACGE